MAINFNQAFAGQSIRTPAAGETLSSSKSNTSDGAAPVGEADAAADARKVAEVVASAPDGGFDASAAQEVDPAELTRAVEQANNVAESTMRATNRSIRFARDDGSGRVTITIREEVNGKEVTRQIPPSQFLRVAERLRELNDGPSAEAPRGTLINVES